MNMLKLTTVAFSLLLLSSVLEMAARADVASDSLEAVYGPEIEERWFSGSMLYNYREALMRVGPRGGSTYDPNDINDVKRAAVDPQSYTKRAAALAYLTYQIRGEAKVMLLSALADPYVSVRCSAARCLAVLGDPNGLASMRRDFAELTAESADVDIESTSPDQRVRQGFSATDPHTRLDNALNVAEVLAQFGDTAGFALASRLILQGEDSRWGSLPARIVTELAKLPERDLQAHNCDPDAVLLAMAARVASPAELRFMSAHALALEHRPASMLRVLERLEQTAAYSELDERSRRANRRLMENAREAIARQAEDSENR